MLVQAGKWLQRGRRRKVLAHRQHAEAYNLPPGTHTHQQATGSCQLERRALAIVAVTVLVVVAVVVVVVAGRELSSVAE